MLVCLRRLVSKSFNVISGAIAQLGERLHGMQEVGGSIPPSSTREFQYDFLEYLICPHRLEA